MAIDPRSDPARRPALAFALLALLAMPPAIRAQATGSAEPDPVLKASAVLPKAQLKGEHHAVSEKVETPRQYHIFTVTSTFGSFEAEGITQVATRINETNALAALHDVSKTEVFLKAAGTSVVNVGTGVASAVTKPVETAQGIGAGVKRLGVNLGRRTQRAASTATSGGDSASSKSTTEKAAGAASSGADSVLGVTSASRAWAKKVGADPYTTNEALKHALHSVAQVDAAGGIAAKVAVPIPMVVSTTADVGDLVWGRDPEELRKFNESRVRELGTSADGAKAFFANRAYTLTMETRLIGALHAVKVPGTGGYLETAAEAETPREALFFVESAEMLQKQHQASRVTAVLDDSRALVAKLANGEALALLPFDWLRRSDETMAAAKELAQRAKAELGATSLRIRVTGQITPRAEKELAAIGWRK